MLCVCVGNVMDVVFSVCIVRRGAVGARVWEVLVYGKCECMGSVSVSSCRCCMFVSCGAVTPAGSVHKSRGDNVVRMWVQLKR